MDAPRGTASMTTPHPNPIVRARRIHFLDKDGGVLLDVALDMAPPAGSELYLYDRNRLVAVMEVKA